MCPTRDYVAQIRVREFRRSDGMWNRATTWQRGSGDVADDDDDRRQRGLRADDDDDDRHQRGLPATRRGAADRASAGVGDLGRWLMAD